MNIQVIGIGLDGSAGLSELARQQVERSTLLVGSDRHLGYFPDYAGDRLVLGNLTDTIAQIQAGSHHIIAILTSGDPLFFGFGRLLLEAFPPEQLTFHPHLSSVQLAFSRVKLAWQEARIISAHGRSFEELIQALQQGVQRMAILTDAVHSPSAIATLIESLDLPSTYRMWVCENLGGENERILAIDNTQDLPDFALLNVVILDRLDRDTDLDLASLPIVGIPDTCFLSFRDRPGLMTKREVRVLAIAELAVQPNQTVWDIGAGTGSVAIEIARLCPTSQIYALEKTAIGVSLIQKNQQRFQVSAIEAIQANVPQGIDRLPSPDRIFIGGSGGNLTEILRQCFQRLAPSGVMVLALATLENLAETIAYLSAEKIPYRALQVQIARSTPIAAMNRFTPLNPVTLITINNLQR